MLSYAAGAGFQLAPKTLPFTGGSLLNNPPGKQARSGEKEGLPALDRGKGGRILLSPVEPIELKKSPTYRVKGWTSLRKGSPPFLLKGDKAYPVLIPGRGQPELT